jgi:hypothetical protein
LAQRIELRRIRFLAHFLSISVAGHDFSPFDLLPGSYRVKRERSIGLFESQQSRGAIGGEPVFSRQFAARELATVSFARISALGNRGNLPRHPSPNVRHAFGRPGHGLH